jgi:hypothetical protein
MAYFKAPKKSDYEKKPQLEMKRADGSILRVYKHKTETGRHRVTIDNKPYNPVKRFEDQIEKGLIKK